MQTIKTPFEKERALQILEKAFHQSPGIIWMIGEKQKKIKSFLSMFLMEASVNNGAYLTSDNNGVVLFFQLQHQRSSLLLTLKKIYVLLFIMGLTRGLQAIKYKKMIDEIRPKQGWFGWLVATDSSVVGNAAAYEIKNFMFQSSDDSQEPVFVETTVPRVRTLYQIAGYIEYASMKHPWQNLDIWFFKREPNLIKK